MPNSHNSEEENTKPNAQTDVARTTEHATNFSHIVSEGLAILALTAIVYLYAYFYETGYCSYRRIPTIFITLGVQNILWASAAAIPAVLILLQGHGFLLVGVSNPIGRSAAYRLCGIGAAITFLAFLGYLILTPEFMSPRAFLFTGLLYVLILYLLNLHFKKATGTAHPDPRHTEAKIVLHEVLEVFGSTNRNWVIYSLTATALFNASLWVLMIGFALGRAEAMWESSFAVTSDSGELVIRRYGDQFILAKYDASSRRLTGQFRLVNAGDFKSVVRSSHLVAIPATTEP